MKYTKNSRFKMPDGYKFRYFKFHLENGNWIKLKARSKHRLKKLAIKHQPLEIFYSTSKWVALDPQRLEHPGYKADRNLIENDLVFDIDNANLKKSYDSSMEIIKKMENKRDYKLKEIHFTGNKGFHLIYKDKKKGSMKEIEKRRKKLIEKFEDPNIDKDITTDLFRVIRLPGSFHRNKKRCENLSPERFISGEYCFTTNDQKTSSSSARLDEKERPGLSSLITFKFIDTRIKGDSHIVFLLFKKELFDETLIKNIQEEYNLSDFFIFKREKYIYAICLKAVHWKRYLKILKRAKASNKTTFRKFKHSWIKISSTLDLTKREKTQEKPKFKKIIKNKENRHHQHSKPHLTYIQNFFDIDYENLCGDKININTKVKVV